MQPISFKRHRFPASVIVHAVWLYARFTLSFRDVEEMLAERGVDASNETVRRWFLKFICLEPSPVTAATEPALASGRGGHHDRQAAFHGAAIRGERKQPRFQSSVYLGTVVRQRVALVMPPF